MFSCLQILEAFLWFVLITLLNVTLIILTLSVSRILNLLWRLVAFLLFLNPQCLASISRWITASSSWKRFCFFVFFFQAEDGIRDLYVTGVQTCALPILAHLELPPEHVIVVDGASSEATAALCSRAGCSHLPCRPGRGLQLRAGIDAARAAGAEILWMVHADCEPHPLAARAVRETIAAGASGGYFNFRFGGDRRDRRDRRDGAAAPRRVALHPHRGGARLRPASRALGALVSHRHRLQPRLPLLPRGLEARRSAPRTSELRGRAALHRRGGAAR